MSLTQAAGEKMQHAKIVILTWPFGHSTLNGRHQSMLSCEINQNQQGIINFTTQPIYLSESVNGSPKRKKGRGRLVHSQINYSYNVLQPQTN